MSSPWPLQPATCFLEALGPVKHFWSRHQLLAIWDYVPGLVHCVVHVVLPMESCLFSFPSVRQHCLVAEAPSPRIFVCTLPSTGDASQVAPFSAPGQHNRGCRLVVHHVDVPLEQVRKSDLGLVEAALDVPITDVLKPSLTSPSRPCRHSLVRWLVGHLIDVGLVHVSSIFFLREPGGGVSHTVTELFSLLWLSHCVDVSLLPSAVAIGVFVTLEADTSCTKPRV